MTDLDTSAKRENKMGIDPVGRLLASMAWPAILSMTINALYNLVDSIFVGMISKEAFTALSIVMPMQFLLIAFGVGSAVGLNSLISRRLGARNQEDADKAASSSFRIAGFNYLLFLFLGLFVAKPFAGLFTNDPVTLNAAVTYMRIVLCFSLFSMVDMALEKVLQATGNMVSPMIISVSGAVTNLVLDPILIFGLGPIPAMGVAGAATATVTGQLVAMSLAMFIVFRKEHLVRVQLFGFKTDWRIIREIYAVGLPGIVMQAIGSFMLFGYNWILAENPTALFVLGSYYKLQSFVFMPVFGIGQGAMPMMGFNYGARNKARLMETYRKALLASGCIMGVGCALFQLFPEALLSIFSADAETYRIGVPALRLISLCFLPAAFGITSSIMFQALGHGVYSLVGSLLRQLIGILPIAYILYHLYGVTISWMAFPLAEVIGLTYSAIMLRHLYIHKIKWLEEPRDFIG